MRIAKEALVGALLSAAMATGCGEDNAKPTPDTTDTTDLGDSSDTPDGDSDGDSDGISFEEQERNENIAAILGVTESERFEVQGLTSEVHVVRTTGSTPHIYAHNQNDLARVLGFVQARDRFFFMDLQRRLGLGQISELLGDAGLASDMEGRGTGSAYVTDRLIANMSEDFKAYLQAFADGVNDYIKAVDAGTQPAPSETQFAGLLGYSKASDMMKPFTLRDVVSLATVFMYATNFETDDLGRAAAAGRLEQQFAGSVNEALRKAGFLAEIWGDITPLFPGTNSTTGFGKNGAEGGIKTASAHSPGQPSAVPNEMVARLHQKLDTRMLRMGKDREAGFGSNIWAVAGSHTADGAALLANDGHLELSVPPLGYGAALDTRLLGRGNLHQQGGWLGNFPVMVGGTNGKVAWGGVNPVLDIVDYYTEQIRLGEDGRPEASLFQGEWKPLKAVEESYVIANVPMLNSVGRTETWTRWETFDGRWIVSVEGRKLAKASEAAEGETVVSMLGDYIVPGDTNGDSIISGVSFDYVAFDATKWTEALFNVGLSTTVEDVRQAARGYVGSALFTSAADHTGSILYTSFQAVPCRTYLERNPDGSFPAGSDPTMLLDGTRYGGFTIHTTEDGKADESRNSDPYSCVIGHNTMPHAVNPPEGFVFNANNDPAGLTDDGEERNDLYYIGGPWASTRANTIRRSLEQATADKQATLDDMLTLQGNIESRVGEVFVPYFLSAIEKVKGLSGAPSDEALARVYAAYQRNPAGVDEVAARLKGWSERGFVAHSGVETFYATPSDNDKADAVATMLFNASFRRFHSLVWDDENISAMRWNGEKRVAALKRYLEGRGAGNAANLASFDAATGESVFFDRANTPEVENSDELLVTAIVEAIEWLSGSENGGFNTSDMNAWLWGMRHQVRFESIISSYVGDDPTLSLITDMFAITTDLHPLMPNLASNDPRRHLKWFPRGGDQWAVDAANPGLSGTNFTYGSGPAMRMAYALKDGKVEGYFILPGGQSGRTESPFFADQVRLWLGNNYHRIAFEPKDVAASATAREVYVPAP